MPTTYHSAYDPTAYDAAVSAAEAPLASYLLAYPNAAGPSDEQFEASVAAQAAAERAAYACLLAHGASPEAAESLAHDATVDATERRWR